MPLAAVPFFAMRIHRTDPERKVAMRSILLRRLRSHPAALDGRLSIRSAEDTARDQLQRNIGDRGDGVCLPASHAFFYIFCFILFICFIPPPFTTPRFVPTPDPWRLSMHQSCIDAATRRCSSWTLSAPHWPTSIELHPPFLPWSRCKPCPPAIGSAALA